MASRNLAKPFFPVPPGEYSRGWMAELVRSFSVYLEQMQNPGEGRATFMVLTNLQTSDYGLETGALFQQNGFVKVTLANAPHVVGVVGTGSVGSVTVTV